MWLAGLFVFGGWMISLCLHEFGHAIVAYFGGDTSVKDKGYLTLNPLNYTDPGLSLLLPMIFLVMGGIALPGGVGDSFLVRLDYGITGRLAGTKFSLSHFPTNFCRCYQFTPYSSSRWVWNYPSLVTAIASATIQ